MNGPTGALLTDLYQLTMLAGYFEQRMTATAVFEFFVRRLPPGRNFLLAAGLEQTLEFLESFRLVGDDLKWLAGSGRFRREFVDSLARMRFTGDVDAIPEGTVCFPNEPLMRVTAPISEAQYVETRIVNLLQFQTLIASKAARCVLAAPDRLLVDFGLRRAHGAEAGLLSARASYLAGFGGTSDVEAGRLFDIPLYGTMAHSFVQAHADETAAFEHFARANPNDVVLLLDTYDTEAAAEKVVALAPRLKTEGIVIKGVRLDSGDLAEHARRVRHILDEGGLREAHIFASGNLDEFKLRELVSAGAPIDGFGVGTRMNTSADAPYFDCAYKLVEYDGHPCRKRSEGKATLPGRKQVRRRIDATGRLTGDVVALEDEVPEAARLLVPVMRGGRRVGSPRSLTESRRHAALQLACLPDSLRALDPAADLYRVEVSPRLRDLAAQVDRTPA